MVVLAISIVSKSGKALVSRQFVDMTRIRMEGLLAAFPKLLGSGKQHTYIETENVRYVYQPMEVSRLAEFRATPFPSAPFASDLALLEFMQKRSNG